MFSTVVVPTTISAANSTNSSNAAVKKQEPSIGGSGSGQEKPFSNSAKRMNMASDAVKTCLESTTYETTEAAKVVL